MVSPAFLFFITCFNLGDRIVIFAWSSADTSFWLFVLALFFIFRGFARWGRAISQSPATKEAAKWGAANILLPWFMGRKW
jgi:hypothetical protein